MKNLCFLLVWVCSCTIYAQAEKPPYCEEGPSTYGSVAAIPGGTTAPALPRFATTPTKEYKIQVAILRYTSPSEFPFHPKLVARYRPCEQVWVVESRESFADHAKAEALQKELKKLGYAGAYITELIGYQ